MLVFGPGNGNGVRIDIQVRIVSNLAIQPSHCLICGQALPAWPQNGAVRFFDLTEQKVAETHGRTTCSHCGAHFELVVTEEA